MTHVDKNLLSILLPDLRGGGAERVNLDLAHAFIASGHEVEFVLMKAEGDFLPEAQASFSVFDLACPRARALPLRISRYLRERRPEALIAGLWPLTAVASLSARLAGYKGAVLLSEHAMLSHQYADWGVGHRLALRASTAVGYRLADALVGVSQGTADDMAALSGLSRKRFSVIHNPIRRLSAPEETRRQNADQLWCGDGPRILSVGALKPVKNHGVLMRAFAALPRANAKLMLLGQGGEESKLRKLAVDLGISDRVIFAGFHPDPAPFYATADMFVLSSDNEGFGNVIVEALSFGLPVVSTDCPAGPAEILENGRWGRLVPVGDAAALAQAMAAALGDTPDRDALRRRAADFAPEIAAKKYLQLLGLT